MRQRFPGLQSIWVAKGCGTRWTESKADAAVFVRILADLLPLLAEGDFKGLDLVLFWQKVPPWMSERTKHRVVS